MNTYGYCLSEIAKEDGLSMRVTKLAFTKAVKAASFEPEGIAEVLPRIIQIRKTLKVPLMQAVRLLTFEPELKADQPKPRKCRACDRPTLLESYYWCGKHVPTAEETHEEYMEHGISN